MKKEEVENSCQLEQLTAVEIWQKLYGKELNCKKNILGYIDILRTHLKENLSQKQIEDSYAFIYKHIESLRSTVKPNTLMFLKNNLKSHLGKYVKEKDPKPINYFIEFFKKAYPNNYRRSDFTRALMDISKITEEQVWTTLLYINRECVKNELKLNPIEKKHIVEVLERAIRRNNIKFINNIRSLKALMSELNINIITIDQGDNVRYKIKKITN
jgi:hypothetical protein